VRYADGIYKVVKPANNTKLSENSKLLLRGSSSKVLFPFTNTAPVYCCLYNKVDDVASAAYMM
jgi:hypothetical protein